MSIARHVSALFHDFVLTSGALRAKTVGSPLATSRNARYIFYAC